MPPHPAPVWQHTAAGLVLQFGSRSDPVPELLTDYLTGPGGIGLSSDAAHDLLRLEHRLRHLIAQLLAQVDTAEQHIAAQRATNADPGPRWPARGRHHRKRAGRLLQAMIAERAETLQSAEGARALRDILRAYVIDLEVSHGLLRHAAHGWARNPDPPATVVVFDDEDAFLDADPRRAAASGWGGPTIAGIEQFGLAWRRDGDEDDPADSIDDPPRGGPWQLGYLQRTGEIYAIRRCRHLSRQVWLLGTGVTALRAARDLLMPIMPRMIEPNSLILAAETVHAAQLDSAPNPVPSPSAAVTSPSPAPTEQQTAGHADNRAHR